MLGAMLQKRAEIQSRKRVPNRYVRSILTPMLTLSFFSQKIKQLIEG
jgi:hypothetical protein